MDREEAARRVPHLRLIHEIGSGAAGTVFLCTPKSDTAVPRRRQGDLLAVKLYNDGVLSEPHQRERIRREARIGLAIGHPNLVAILQTSDNDAHPPFITMEYIDGPTLAEWLKSFPQVRDALLLRFLLGLLEGLAALHNAGVLHRDVKPQNILLTPDFDAVLADFGVAYETTEPRVTTHPDQNHFLGTRLYAAPERLSNPEAPPTSSSDLYSLGAVLYELLYERAPFDATNAVDALIYEKLNTEPVFFKHKAHSTVRIRLAELCRRLLRSDPHDRPPDATALLQELRSDPAISEAIQSSSPLRAYMACALTNLTPEEQEGIMFVSHSAAKAAMEFDIYTHQPRTVTDPALHKDVPAERVYELDRRRAIASDLMIVLGNRPSFGVGMELEIAASAGVPTILLLREKLTISRMVKGSTLNVIGTVEYQTPEQLERGIQKVLRERMEVLTQYHLVHEMPVLIDVGNRLREQREAQRLSVSDLASRSGVSSRLVELLETEPTWFLNAGLDAVQRICKVLSLGISTALEAPSAADGTRVDALAKSLTNLHDFAREDGLSRDEMCSLENDFLRGEKAARGSGKVISLDEWRRRRPRT